LLKLTKLRDGECVPHVDSSAKICLACWSNYFPTWMTGDHSWTCLVAS